MATSKNLTDARNSKSDEFYTRLPDIEAELSNYPASSFAGKTVYCNCDEWSIESGGKKSNFFAYFVMNFNRLGLGRLVCTSYSSGGHGQKVEVVPGAGMTRTMLAGDGSFDSAECLDILDKSDIVVTNPPFSLLKTYLRTLVEHGRKFIVLGNINAITCRDVFPLVESGKVWFGKSNFNGGMYFNVPDEYEFNEDYKFRQTIDGKKVMRLSSVCWFTNMEFDSRTTPIDLTEKYDPVKYPKYDNYDAIEVSRFPLIPKDYAGTMGVPITFLGKFSPSQFKIVGLTVPRAKLAGKTVYARVLVRNLHPLTSG